MASLTTTAETQPPVIGPTRATAKLLPRTGREAKNIRMPPTITIARPSTTVFHWETNSLKSRSVPILTMKMPVIILEMAIRPASVNRVVGTTPVQNRIRNVTEAKSSTGMMACVLSEMKSPIANTTHTIVRANIPSIDFSSLFFSLVYCSARALRSASNTRTGVMGSSLMLTPTALRMAL